MSRQDKPKKQIKEVSRDTIKRVAILVLNTMILTVFYFGTRELKQPILDFLVTGGYWLAFAGFTIGYIMYNRGFTQNNITPEMLPDSWDAAKKAEFIDTVKERYKKSRWMLYAIIPLLLPITLDLISMYTIPMIQNLFNIK